MRQNFMGVVVGTAMQKTVKVRVMSQKIHPIVRKVIVLFKADHPETDQLYTRTVIGNRITIEGKLHS